MNDINQATGATATLSKANDAFRKAIIAWYNEQDGAQRPKRWNALLDAAEAAVDARSAFRDFMRGLPHTPPKRPPKPRGSTY